nr:hypothetical protein [Tanacetum cinerariifolium]
MVVVEMDMDHYPLDFEGVAGQKDELANPEPAPIIPNHAPDQLDVHLCDVEVEDDVEEEDPEEEPEEGEPMPEPNNNNGFALHMNPQPKGNMKGWLIEDDDDELKEYVVGDDDEEEMEVDENDEENGGNDDEDDAEVIHSYEDADPLNRPPPTSDVKSKFAPPVVPIVDTNNESVPPVIQFGGNFHVGESSSTGAILADVRQEYDITALDAAKLVADKVAEALAVDRPTRNNTNVAGGSGGSGGQGGVPPIRECTFAGFMKSGPTQYHGTEGDVKLCHWFV